MPAGEPLSFTFNMDPRRSIVIYIFPFDKPFSDDEKKIMEWYATDCMFYLAKLQLDEDVHTYANISQITGLPNASGYLNMITDIMDKNISLSGYSAFYFNLKDFGDINRRYGKGVITSAAEAEMQKDEDGAAPVSEDPFHPEDRF